MGQRAHICSSELRQQKSGEAQTVFCQWLGFLPHAAFGAFLLFFFATLVSFSLELRQHARFVAEKQSVHVLVNLPMPRTMQESVDLAVAMYTIDHGSAVENARFDALLEDRGLTSGGTFSLVKTVTVGPAAFTSWAVLGSTLGHEVEVHGRQSFAMILSLDSMGKLFNMAKASWNAAPAQAAMQTDVLSDDAWGTWKAERTAYLYEVRSAERFGLSHDEIQSIFQVMNYYYPAK